MEVFNSEVKAKADQISARYETRRAAILEILRLLQETYGHITREMEEAVGKYLEIPAIDVREIMTFYSLFYDKPKARTRFHVCRTLACYLRGGEAMAGYLEEKLGIRPGEMTSDGKFSLHTVECLGACEMAPMMQVNDEGYIGPLTKDKIDRLLREHKS